MPQKTWVLHHIERNTKHAYFITLNATTKRDITPHPSLSRHEILNAKKKDNTPY